MSNRILIVEDEAILALTYELALISHGFLISGPVSCGEDALKLVEEDTPDLIIMDIILQGQLDGIETAEIIMKKKAIPILFLTGSTDTMTQKRALGLNTCGYLHKPIETADLCKIIDNILSE